MSSTVREQGWQSQLLDVRERSGIKQNCNWSSRVSESAGMCCWLFETYSQFQSDSFKLFINLAITVRT